MNLDCEKETAIELAFAFGYEATHTLATCREASLPSKRAWAPAGQDRGGDTVLVIDLRIFWRAYESGPALGFTLFFHSFLCISVLNIW